MRADRLIDLLKTLPADAMVTGHMKGFFLTNHDGTGEVIVLNETLRAPAETSSQKPKTAA